MSFIESGGVNIRVVRIRSMYPFVSSNRRRKVSASFCERRAIEAQVLSRSRWMVSAVPSSKTDPICT